MKQLYSVYILTPLLLLIVSCTIFCKGEPDKIYVTGVNLVTTRDTITPYNQIYTHNLQLLPVSQTDKGETNGMCGKRVFSTEEPEKLDSADMQVYCDKDLRSKNVTVQSGENLLRRKDVFKVNVYLNEGLFSSGALMIQTDSLQNGPHVFYVAGKTTRGNNYSDSIIIYYH